MDKNLTPKELEYIKNIDQDIINSRVSEPQATVSALRMISRKQLKKEIDRCISNTNNVLSTLDTISKYQRKLEELESDSKEYVDIINKLNNLYAELKLYNDTRSELLMKNTTKEISANFTSMEKIIDNLKDILK